MNFLRRFSKLKYIISVIIILIVLIVLGILYTRRLEPSYYFFGDSITMGVKTKYPEKQRWATLICNQRHVNQYNFGVSGQPLTSVDAGYGINSGFMANYSDLIPKKEKATDRLVFAYGTNDIGSYNYYGPAKATSVDHFKSAYRRVFSFCLKQGWKPEDILVISRYYFKEYPNQKLVKLPVDQNRANNFSIGVQEVCKEFGIQNCIDLTQSMIQAGGTKILVSDETHPDVKGHEVIATAINSWLKDHKSQW
ncbi:SGNH/GDSL hydrolase family protein [Mucilaginibacter kameinonensis]|uniref:SGNH/GDSL hydrolase family protein n=1 Tax=Mucilaginibacter kameinonensis TaxID=452286 RepID=UPI000EF7FE85|nr:SGNH/GDSL hydrolase family protein [Mucilaginibacter kameinonensis]